MTFQVFKNRLFIVCACFLLAMSVGMKPAAHRAGKWLEKRPVPIRKPLRQMALASLPSFSHPRSIELQDTSEIGTEEYGAWRVTPTGENLRWRHEISLTVSYYTQDGVSMTLQIPHTPEVCYRQSGTQITDSGEFELALGAEVGDTESLKAKYFRMSNPTEAYNKDIIVAYVLCVNGRFCTDREVARIFIASPWNRAVYFAKVECMIDLAEGGRPDEALIACRQLLAEVSAALITDHLPTSADIDHAAQ